MMITKQVEIEWFDVHQNQWSNNKWRVDVAIDESWYSHDNDDPDIFWYFSTEEEYRTAFTTDYDLDFRIIREV